MSDKDSDLGSMSLSHYLPVSELFLLHYLTVDIPTL